MSYQRQSNPSGSCVLRLWCSLRSVARRECDLRFGASEVAIDVGIPTLAPVVWRTRLVRSLAPLAWLALCAGPISAGQIPLTPASVIGGSGAWSTERWDSGQFAAGLVVDNQSAFLIDEPDPNAGGANGGYWLGKEGDQGEFFVLDLGQQYGIGWIELFPTHDATLNDRSTNGYEIYGGTAVQPIDRSDEPQAGGMDLADPVLLVSGTLRRQVVEHDPIEPQWVDVPWPSPCIRYLHFNTVGPLRDVPTTQQRGVGLNEIQVFSDVPVLQAGDADMDLDVDQLDFVQALQAGKYLTGEPATWGEGDWDAAPGGEPGNPPTGDGLFNQHDIISTLNSNIYLTGPYADPPCGTEGTFTGVVPEPVVAGGTLGDAQTSIVYDPSTGDVAVDAPAGTELTSVSIDSKARIFTGDRALNLGGSYDVDADNNIFKATFGTSFGSISFGNVAQLGLTPDSLLNDLTVAGSLAGGGGLGPVDLVYMHELFPGDANQDFSFDQPDIVQVLQAAKYLTDKPATWGEGDWNGGPGGYPGEPPAGDGVFDQHDIVAALQGGVYLTGRYDGMAGESVASAGVAAVPEPATIVLLAFGFLLAISLARGEGAIRGRRRFRFPMCCLVIGIWASTSWADIKNWETGETIPGTEGITLEPGVQLDHRELAYAKLSEVDLTGANLAFSNLPHAILSQSNLTSANLAGANLRGATLFKADLTGATLLDVDFSGATLSGSTFSGGLRGSVNFDGSDLGEVHDTIGPSGQTLGLNLSENRDAFVVHDHQLPIAVSDHFVMDGDSQLRLVLSDDQWGSTIRLSEGVTPELGGTLRIEISPAYFGWTWDQTFDLFDWTVPLEASNTFDHVELPSGTECDLSRLYTTGEIVLAGLPCVVPLQPGDADQDGDFDRAIAP